MSDHPTAPAPTPAPTSAPAPPPDLPNGQQSQPGQRNSDPNALSVSAAARLMRSQRQAASQTPAQAPQPQTSTQPPAGAPTATSGLLEPSPEAIQAFEAQDTGASPPPAVPDQPRHRVRVDGEEIEVTLEEALAGYSRQKDYQQKTARLADKERAAEQAANEARAERQRAAQAIDRVLAEVGPALVPEQDLDRLLETDPTAYHREMRRRTRVQEALNERLRLDEVERAEQMASVRRFTEAEGAKLLEKRPEWRDPAAMKQVQTDLRGYALDQGFSHADVNNVRDHRLLLLLEKAMKYDRLIARKPQPVSTSNGPATAPPGSTPASPRASATAAVREAEGTFAEAPTLKNALGMLRARRTGGR